MENETKNLSIFLTETLRTKGISAERLSQVTGISERFIDLLLGEKFDSLPAAPYVHGYLLKIAEVLNLDGEKLWQEYLKDNKVIQRFGEKDLLPQNRFSVSNLNKTVLFFVLLVVLVGIYVIYQGPAILAKPVLVVDLKDYTEVNAPVLKIVGRTESNNQLTINGQTVYLDKEGKFEEILNMEPGFNTIEFKVRKFLAKELTLVKQVFYRTPPAPPASENETPNSDNQ